MSLFLKELSVLNNGNNNDNKIFDIIFDYEDDVSGQQYTLSGCWISFRNNKDITISVQTFESLTGNMFAEIAIAGQIKKTIRFLKN